MKLIFAPVAVKGLRGMPAKDAAAMVAILKEIAVDPFAPCAKAKRLTGHPGFRVRHGDWRAVYRLDPEAGEMVVNRVGHRREVYR